MVDPTPVPLLVVGCDFRTAPTLYRETMLSSPLGRAQLIEDLRRIDPEAEFLALETCNRVEWMVATDQPAWISEILKARILSLWNKVRDDRSASPEPYAYVGQDALTHIFRVVVGLESLATGEAQIAGQFQDGLNRAREEKTTGVVLNRLGTAGGHLAKASHRLGFRSNHQAGIHVLATRYLRSRLPPEAAVVVVGMGQIGRKCAEALEERGSFRVHRLNRTLKPQHRGHWTPLEDLRELTPSAEAVVMASGALKPVLRSEHLEDRKSATPLWVMDIGIPRQVSPDLQQDSRIAYRNIDHLIDVDESGAEEGWSDALENEIGTEIERFMRFCGERRHHLNRLLATIHSGRGEYVHQHIPQLLEKRLGTLSESERKDVQEAMKELINRYANDVHASLLDLLDEYWNPSLHNSRTIYYDEK